MLARQGKERGKHTHRHRRTRAYHIHICSLYYVLLLSFLITYATCLTLLTSAAVVVVVTAAVTVALAVVAIKSNSLSLPIAALTLNRSLWTKLHLTYALLCAHVCVRVTVFRLSLNLAPVSRSLAHAAAIAKNSCRKLFIISICTRCEGRERVRERK